MAEIVNLRAVRKLADRQHSPHPTLLRVPGSVGWGAAEAIVPTVCRKLTVRS
jgi:hypothetical protein